MVNLYWFRDGWITQNICGHAHYNCPGQDPEYVMTIRSGSKQSVYHIYLNEVIILVTLDEVEDAVHNYIASILSHK
jgi:hypothetical protein